MMVIASPPCHVTMAEPAMEEEVMPLISLEAYSSPKVSPFPIIALELRSSARWRGPNYPIHLFQLCSAEGLPYHCGRYLGKELLERSKCVAKAANTSSEKGGPN